MLGAALCPCRFTWIVVLGAIAAFFAAFGIGANDVANAYATSVGSKALTVKQACALAIIFEFLGATFLGGSVVETIRRDIADIEYFADDPALLMWGCFCVIFCVGVWLLLMSYLEIAVSTTHSCVGGMIGMSIAAKGYDAVHWARPSSSFPWVNGFAGVVLSWILSPLLSGLASMCLFATLRALVLRSARPFERAVLIFPICVAMCFTIITWFMLVKGIKSSEEIQNLEVGTQIGIAFCVGVGLALAGIPAYMMCKKRILNGTFVVKMTAIEEADAAAAAASRAEGGGCRAAEVEMPTTMGGKVMRAVATSLNSDPHASVGVDAATTAIHRFAEKFDRKAEAFFTYLQIFSAIFDSFAHGANDVANAVGPFATIFVVYSSGVVSSKADMGEHRYWILGLGGIGIGIGLLLYGYKIMRAIGVKLAVITPARGFCIEMGSSLIVILGSYAGIPLSTTHCQVGATTGVALLEGSRACSKWVVLKVAIGALITCFCVGILSALLFSLGAYAPMAKPPPPTRAACAAIGA